MRRVDRRAPQAAAAKWRAEWHPTRCRPDPAPPTPRISPTIFPNRRPPGKRVFDGNGSARAARLAAVLLLGLALLPAACRRAAPAQSAVRVAAAASLKDVLTAAADAYRADTGRSVAFTFGASGTLAAQVRQGAPIDLYLSADAALVDRLADAGAIVAGTRATVAGNRLVIVAPAGSTAGPLAGPADLTGPAFAKIAAGEPTAVPAGRYAAQVFVRLGLTERLRPKLVYAADVRQALAYAAAGEVDAAVVYASDARAAAGKVRVLATIDPALHDPIRYDAAVVAGSNNAAAARAFLDYLKSPAGQAAFGRYGFAKSDGGNPPP